MEFKKHFIFSIRSKIMMIILVLIVLTLSNSYFVFLTDENADARLVWVQHSNEVRLESERFLSFMKDAETGQRGYLLTNNPSYLTPYEVGQNEASKSFKKLLALTSDNQQQKNRLSIIKNLLLQKFEELNLTIELTSKNESAKAIEIVNSDKGKQIMDQIRAEIQSFTDMENLLLVERSNDFYTEKNNLRIILFIEFLGTIILVIFIWFALKNMLINPLNTLVHLTEKMHSGEKLSIDHLVKKDEIGFLIASFYKMNEKIYSYTEDLVHQAHYDKLTALPNRTYAYEALYEKTNKQNASKFKVAVCFLDLNKFKTVNDTHGHDIGDELLKIASQRLKDSIRDEDVVCRLGGDEFLVILDNITHRDQIEYVLEGIIKAFSEPVTIKGININLSSSIGVSTFPDDSENVTELLKFSDLAMYSAKENKTHFSFFDKESMLDGE